MAKKTEEDKDPKETKKQENEKEKTWQQGNDLLCKSAFYQKDEIYEISQTEGKTG